MSSTPLITINGSASFGGGSSTGFSVHSIGQDYASLIATGSTAFAASGAKIFTMDAGTLANASQAQVGTIRDGVIVTQQMVDQDCAFLAKIADFCRTNGISVHVEAQLDNAPSEDWTYQWLTPAINAGLPITAVINDNEPEVSSAPESFAVRAGYEVSIVRQITAYYPDVKIGQYETRCDLDKTKAWWDAYNNAADAAGLPRISLVVADTPWNAPWSLSQQDWESWQLGLSDLASSRGVDLEVLLNGVQAGVSNEQWTAQSEQHAAMLARLSNMKVTTLLIRTWDPAYPDSVLPVNSPTTIANAAAEIAATYGLYAAGQITGKEPASVTAASQFVVRPGQRVGLPGVALNGSDASGLYAIVLMSTTGLLYANPSGSATVGGSGTTKLVLNGNLADLATILSGLSVSEGFKGPDSLDIEVFGASGRLSDTQLTLFALPNSPTPARTIDVQASDATQGWLSASMRVETNNIVSSETLIFAPASYDPVTQQAVIARSVSIHAPLGQSNLAAVNGRVISNDANASGQLLPIGTSFVVQAFDPSGQLFKLNVLQSTFDYSNISGHLLSEKDVLAPSTLSPVALQAGFGNYLASGGTQITEYNTGDNPNWSANWNPTLSYVRTTYGSSGQILEQVFQGGPTQPYFTLDNVFNPYTGQLLEQIQSAPAPALFSDFVTGTKYVTQYNTGDNPNWDWADWGNSSRVTAIWQDWHVVGVTTSPPVPTGLADTYAYHSTSGQNASGALGNVTLASVPGGHSTLIGGDGTTSILGTGADTIYAGLGITTLSTGLGGSQVYLVGYRPTQVTIASGGGDAIWTGEATATITQQGTTCDNVVVQGGTVSLLGTGFAVSTAQNTTSKITASGALVQIDLRGTGDTVALGNNGTVVFDGTGALVQAIGAVTANAWGSGNTLIAGNGSAVWLTSGQNTVTLGNDSMVDQVGTGNISTLGDRSTGYQYGLEGTITARSFATINQYQDNNTATVANSANALMAGNHGTIIAGANAQITVTGTSNTIRVGNSARISGAGSGTSVTLLGTGGVADLGNAGTVSFNGSGALVRAGSSMTANAWGTGNTLVAGDHSTIWLTAGQNTVTLGNDSMVDQVGARNVSTIGDRSVGFQYGLNGTITAGSSSTVNQYQDGNTATLGNSANVLMAADRGTVSAGANAKVTVTGNGNIIRVGDNARISGTGNSTSVDLLGTGGVVDIGNNGTVTFDGVGALVRAGPSITANAWGFGNALIAGDHSTVWLTAGQNTVTLGSDSMVDQVGARNISTIGDRSVGFQYGLNGTITARSFATINQYQDNNTATVANSANALMAGNHGTIIAGANAQITVTGTSNTIRVGNSARISGAGSGTSVTLLGTGGVADLGNAGTVSFNGSGALVRAGSSMTANAWGTGNTLVAGDHSTIWLTAGQNTVTLGNDSMVDQVGARNVSTIGDRSVGFQYGLNGTITAGSSSTVNQYQDGNTATLGNSANVLIAANRGTVSAGANAKVTVTGNGNTLRVGDSSTITLKGSGNSAYLGGSAMAFISGSNDTIKIGKSGGSQVISGFSLASHSVLDLSEVLSTVVSRRDFSVQAYISVQTVGSNTILSMLGGQEKVTLASTGKLMLSDLISHHALTFNS